MSYYKVVIECHDGTLMSVWAPRGAAVVYTPQQKTKPAIEGSKLFVFDHLQHAYDWRETSQWQIWRCQVENPEPARVIMTKFGPLVADYLVSSFWKGFNEYGEKLLDYERIPLTRVGIPHGTVLVTSVILMERVA